MFTLADGLGTSIQRGELTASEGAQSFQYLAPRKNISPSDYELPECPVGGVEWMHIVCDYHRAESILAEVDELRDKGWRGRLAWEPLIRVRACLGALTQVE